MNTTGSFFVFINFITLSVNVSQPLSLWDVGKCSSTVNTAFNKICPGYTPTEYQINAILADDKRILITGAPSTGKTTALIAKYEYLKSKGIKEVNWRVE